MGAQVSPSEDGGAAAGFWARCTHQTRYEVPGIALSQRRLLGSAWKKLFLVHVPSFPLPHHRMDVGIWGSLVFGGE